MTEDAIRVSPRTPGPGPDAGAGRPGPRAGRLPVTTELVVLCVVALAVLVAAAVADGFGATGAWTLVTVLAAAYILSRGLAKHERPRDDGLG